MRLNTYADDSPLQLNFDQMAAKAAGLIQMCSHVTYSDRDDEFCVDSLYCPMGLANMQCSMKYHETQDLC